MRIDSHHHFWRYNADEYGWIAPHMSVLRRDFLPADLHQAMTHEGIEAAVSVQARQSVAETKWLLEMAGASPFIGGVVGWAPLRDDNIESVLAGLMHPKLAGVRHVVQDEPDDRFILDDHFNRGVAAAGRLGLVYDILIFERQLAAAIEFVDRHPTMVFVLDHVAKPRIAKGEREPWQSLITELARRPNVYCKVSGMVTEADWHGWTQEQLHPYWDIALHAFGPQRLMFGSDWPVCLLACSYGRWHDLVRQWTSKLTLTEQRLVLGHTAIEAYKLRERLRGS